MTDFDWEKRALLERYCALDSHHCFKLNPEVDPTRRWYEGFIYEVREHSVIFSWAPSPLMESDEDWMEKHEIAIRDIDLSTLIW